MPEDERFRELAWEIIHKHLSDPASLVRHQTDSFDAFVRTGIDSVIRSYGPIDVTEGPYENGVPALRFSIRLSDVSVGRCITHDSLGRPSVILPNDARLRNISYTSSLTADLDIESSMRDECGVVSTGRKVMKGVVIGSIPIMVGSSYCALRDRRFRAHECHSDPAGYFIINGNEKAMVCLDRIAENKTYVFQASKSTSPNDSIVAEVRSVGDTNPGCPKTACVALGAKPTQHGGVMRITFNGVRTPIPVAVLFRALGVESDSDILDWIVALATPLGIPRQAVEEDMVGSFADGCIAHTEHDAIVYIMKYTSAWGASGGGRWRTPSQQVDAVRDLIRTDLLPHVGADNRDKTAYVAYMVARLIRVKRGIAPMDDRDSYVNKRIDTPGALLTGLFRQHFCKFVREVRSLLHKEIQLGTWRTTMNLLGLLSKNNLYKIIRPTVIGSGMTYALATGNWGVKNSRTCKQGVAQILNRMNFNATVSHLRRVNTRIEKTGKLVQPRKLHTSHWGVMCLAETPEGSSIGLVKNLALTACVSGHTSPRPVADIVSRRTAPVDPASPSRLAIVLVNGRIAGHSADPAGLAADIRAMKRVSTINPLTSVVWDIAGGELRVNTEAGRCCRPVLTVTNRSPDIMATSVADIRALTLAEIAAGAAPGIQKGAFEYIDVDEAGHSLIAMSPADLASDRIWTHIELDPCVCLGVVAATIPFSHHNQSPRNTYQCAMAKQAIGLYSTRFRSRYDTIAHVLHYPQRPIVNTRIASRLHVDSLPSGINAVVAIATHSGFNQEDSVIFNQAAVDRGLFSSTFYRTYKEHNSRNHSTGEEEHYYKPGPGSAAMKAYNYDKITESGFVPENTFVDSRDIIIGKCMPNKINGSIVSRDSSVPVKSNEHGFVDANCFNDNRFTTTTSDGYSFCKVRVRSTRKPVIGDKFSSRSGQKGTVGIVARACDMPFTSEGIIPDIVMNPHAVPSRMTVGQLLECVIGKACCLSGELFGDATPFRPSDVDRFGDALQRLGMCRHANETMFCGITGRPVDVTVFIGPTYYQRLKHMTADKCHSRSANGPVTALVRQPAEGRARDGGLRLGEMELGCLVGHGANFLLSERVYKCSDPFSVFACSKCGRPCVCNTAKGIRHCSLCSAPGAPPSPIVELRIPYAFKLLKQECESMGISMHLHSGSRRPA